MSTLGHGVRRASGRPVKIFVDKYGEVWLCDVDVDTKRDLEAQGCVRESHNPQNE